MLELVNQKKHNQTLVIVSLLIIVGMLLIGMVTSNLLGALLIGMIIEFLFLTQKITLKLSIDHTGLKVLYYRFFSKNEIQISSGGIKSKADYQVAFRSPKYLTLKIYKKNKLMYTIDSRDGFLEEDLKKMEYYINNLEQ